MLIFHWEQGRSTCSEGEAAKLTPTIVYISFIHSEHTLAPVAPQLCFYKALRDEQVLNQTLPLKLSAKKETEKIRTN